MLQSVDSLVILSSAFGSDLFEDVAPEAIIETYEENGNILEQISLILADYTDIKSLYVLDSSETWSTYLEQQPNLAQSFGDGGNLLFHELSTEAEGEVPQLTSQSPVTEFSNLGGNSDSVVQTFYVPGKEGDILSAFESLTPNAANDNASVPGSPVNSTISLSTQGDNTVIYYDHWEDGLEVDLNNPTQNTTEIWGDNDPSNGIAPGFETDILGAGEAIALNNKVPVLPERDGSEILYDGRDKIGASEVIVATRTAWADKSGTLLAGAWEVFDTSKFGTSFIFPVGENVDSGDSEIFEYVGLTVTASENATVLQIDTNGDGNQVIDVVLNEGESHFVDGGIQAGGTLSADKPVQSHLISGNISASPDASGSRTYYASRWFTLYPDAQWSNSYYTPVGDTAKNQTNVFVHNPNDNPITVNYEYRNNDNNLVTRSFDIEAGEVYLHKLESTSGYHFYTDDLKDIFAASSTVSSGNISREGNNATYDWGHNVISESNLTPVVAMGWAPGSDDRNNDNSPDENSSPVWVTATNSTRVYVNYSGDQSQGALIDSSGDRYDVHFDVDRLESLKIYDDSDQDMSRARIYTTDGTNISAAWGQDPDTASAGFPAIDVGKAILPLPISTAAKTVELVVDNKNPEIVDPGDVLEYTVEIRNDGLTPLTGINVSDILPDGTSYVADTSSVNSEPLADNPLGTTFPLDDDGVDNGIDSGAIIGDIPVGGTAEFTYQLAIDDPYKGSLLGVLNEANITSNNGFIDTTLRTPVEVPVETKTLYFSDTQDLDRIDPVESGDTTTAETAAVREELYLDRFDSEAYDNNDGSLNWNGGWFESGDNEAVDSGDVRIRQSKVRIDHDDDTPPSIARKIDLSGVSSAVFSFDFSTTKSVDTTDNMIVEASSDGGETFTTLETLTGEFLNSTAREYNLEEFIDLTADTVVRFRVPEQTGAYPNYAGTSEFFDLDNVKISQGSQVNFQQAIPLADDLVLFEGFNISVTAYLDLSNGVLNVDNPENNDILAKLTYDTGEIADFGKPVLVNTIGDNIYQVSWEAEVSGDSTIPQGENFNLEIANEQNNLDFKVLYDSAEYPSQVDIRTPSLIQVASIEVYDTSETGEVVNAINNIDTNYIRVAVTDPFGDYDIRNLDLSIIDAEGNPVITETLDDSFLVNETPGDNLKTYEYPWTPGRDVALGEYRIEVTGHEGLETGLEAVSYTDSTSIEIKNGIIPNLAIGDAEVVEGEQLVFDFALSDVIEVDIVLDLAATDDTASNSLDYDFGTLEYSTDGGETWLAPEGELGTIVTIPAGNSDIQVRVNSTEDKISELNENFGLGVANVVSGRIGDTSDVGLGTIQDNDPLPTISIDNISLEEGNEGGKEFNFTVNLTHPSSQIITVDYATADNTATIESNDYFPEAGTLSFAPGETSQTISVLVNGDTSVELAAGIIESFTLDLANAINATIDEANFQGIGEIIDDDAVARFAINDVTQVETNEDTTQFVFTVTRSEDITEATAVDYSIANGTADSEDYLATKGTIKFEPEVTEQEIVVEVTGDELPEGDDTFVVTLSNPFADGAIDDAEGIGTITNDDFYGEITGQVSVDIDNDDVGDNLLGGIVIELKDAEGNTVQQTTTGFDDENGKYRFSDVLPGNYTVVQTNLDNSYSDVTPNSIPVNVVFQETSADNNFVDEQLGSISGKVLTDINNDDTGDEPIVGVKVELLEVKPGNPAGNLVASASSDEDGSYLFGDIAAGNYQVVQTNLDENFTDVTDATIELTLAAGAESTDNNFIDEQLGSISGKVLVDTNYDGTGDRPIADVSLSLQDTEGNILATTTTNLEGSYIFGGITAGTYNVIQTNLNDSYQDVADSDGDNPNNIEVVLNSGEFAENNDFLDEQPGIISGTDDADTIDGTNDDDTIIGYGGADTLRGGEGNDTFVFKTITDGVDLITDFSPGQDRLDISEILEEDLNYTGEDPVADGHVLFKDCFGGTMLQIDPDGEGELPPENVAFVYGASSQNANLMFGNENGESFAPAAPLETFYFSLQENSFNLAGNDYRDEDIVKFDGEEFTTFFDGSDVQVSALDLEAFDIISDSEILLSFSTPRTIVVDGEDVEVDDSDIVKFIGSQMGDDTEGTYEMFFDGSEYGLNAALEDIDGIHLLDEENLLISTSGSSDNIIEGLSVSDEDILQVNLSAPEPASAWSIYVDGSDIGLDDNNQEDVNAITVNSQNDVFLSTIANATVPDRTGNNVPVNSVSALEFNPTYVGNNTSGSFDRTPIFDGNNFGLDAENINAMSIELVGADI